MSVLISMLESLAELIGNPSMCRGILKSNNALKNKDFLSTKSIKKNIYDDFRMIYDRGQYRGDVKIMCDGIEEFLEKKFP